MRHIDEWSGTCLTNRTWCDDDMSCDTNRKICGNCSPEKLFHVFHSSMLWFNVLCADVSFIPNADFVPDNRSKQNYQSVQFQAASQNVHKSIQSQLEFHLEINLLLVICANNFTSRKFTEFVGSEKCKKNFLSLITFSLSTRFLLRSQSAGSNWLWIKW